jgi:superoxide dismutase, Cu-Zn family
MKTIVCLLVMASALGCGSARKSVRTEPPVQQSAEARLQPASGSTVTGMAQFHPSMFNRVTLVIDVNNLPPGRHAVHLHERGDCSAPDATSAGKELDPAQPGHGDFDKEPYHLGDIDNLIADARGHARMEIASREWSIGTGARNDVLGKAVVIHQASDDPTALPSGNSATRIACGVIEAAMPEQLSLIAQ